MDLQEINARMGDLEQDGIKLRIEIERLENDKHALVEENVNFISNLSTNLIQSFDTLINFSSEMNLYKQNSLTSNRDFFDFSSSIFAKVVEEHQNLLLNHQFREKIAFLTV